MTHQPPWKFATWFLIFCLVVLPLAAFIVGTIWKAAR